MAFMFHDLSVYSEIRFVHNIYIRTGIRDH